jgi:uncharacterized protein YbjT (DUF2867 family)
MRILIVGATGGLGQDSVAQALARGHETAALVRDPGRAACSETVEIVRGDVLDPSSLKAAIVGRDAVICALGTPSPRRRSTLLEQGTKNLVVAMSSKVCGGWPASHRWARAPVGRTARSFTAR